MSLKVDYETVEEAKMRLVGTIVRYDGQPVYITAVSSVNDTAEGGGKDIFRVYANPLPLTRDAARGQEQFRKYISSKKFDLSPVKLGFINQGGRAIFVTRSTARQNQQGLNEANCLLTSLDGLPSMSWSKLIYDVSFLDGINGKYPSIQEALRRLRGLDKSVAVSRDVALSMDEEIDLITVHYRDKRVGFCADDEVKISRKFKYLKEAFQEINL